MPKSKRNKTVDLSKTKKHGLEGKKELYKKIQSNVENYAHVFVFAVNDMRNSKMKNVREQWKHSRFCIGKNKVMAMALGRTPEEEYRTNLHQIGKMLLGERGLLFTNQSVEEVTNWFQSYSEGDYARSGNIATEDVVLSEGPLAQFPHNLESYLRQLGLPTTLKKGVIHLVKEHVVCTEGDRLSPETARILKLLGYEMAEFHIKILSVWSQDGSFINLQSDSCSSESKENAASAHKSFMKEDFELAKDCLLLGDDDDEMEVAENDDTDENKMPTNSQKGTELKNVEDLEEEKEELKVVKNKTPKGKVNVKETKETSISLKEAIDSSSMLKLTQTKLEEPAETPKSFMKEDFELAKDCLLLGDDDEMKVAEDDKTGENKMLTSSQKETESKNVEEDLEEEKEELKVKKHKTPKGKIIAKKTKEASLSKKEAIDTAAILKLTQTKLEESAEKPKKFSPKMTRARAAAANIKIKTPETETKKTTRKRKM